MDEQLKSHFEHVLQHYAEVIKARDAALLREKTAREQFEGSFRAAVDSVILPAAAQVKELVARTNWVCLATKSDNGLSAKVEIYQGNMKATTGERPHVKLLAAAKANDVQIYIASQSTEARSKAL
jgi:predicted double-glycine peptidase